MSTLNPSFVQQDDTHISAKKGDINASDADLWHAYLRAISDYFPFAGSPDGYRIYTAPLTSFGVTIGRAVDTSIVNHDLIRLGDLLLPPDSPIFLPGLSYSKRLRRYLQAVVIPPGRQDAASLTRLEKAKEQLDDATNSFIKCRSQAYAAYISDPAYVPPVPGASATTGIQIPFDSWVKAFYPAYELASLRKDALSQQAYEAHLDYFGAQTASLWQDKTKLDLAFEASSLNNPYNMPTCAAQVKREAIVGAGTQLPPLDIMYQPRYNIDAKFSEEALSWVLNANNGKNAPLEITFHSHFTSRTRPTDWKDLGFSKVSLENHNEVLARVPLFTAHIHDEPTPTKMPNYQVGFEEEDTSVTVTIRASDAAVFPISPDQSWDIPDITSRYPKLRADASSDLFQPLVLVTHVFLGYQVSITMELDDKTYRDIDKGMTRCQNSGGAASLFGLSLGPRSTSSMVGFDQVTRDPSMHTISIPPRDNSQLTLIGLMGKKLAAPIQALPSKITITSIGS